MEFIARKAQAQDVAPIVELLLEDDLGGKRESSAPELDQKYLDAFAKIDKDSNQYLMVIEDTKEIIATCHLTIMPSLTFKGATRMQIEAVRVSAQCRGQNIGKYMFEQVMLYAKKHEVSILQLTTNKMRPRAKHFYEKLGFEASHEGMKLYL